MQNEQEMTTFTIDVDMRYEGVGNQGDGDYISSARFAIFQNAKEAANFVQHFCDLGRRLRCDEEIIFQLLWQ